MTEADDALVAARVGERWVLRHRRADGSASDVIGWLQALEDPVRVLVADGNEVALAKRALIAARRVPAAAGGPHPRRVSAAELERRTVDGWCLHRAALGEWTLRAAGGFTARANSCHAVGDPGMPASSAADRIRSYADRHGIAARAQVIPGTPADRALLALGWHQTHVPAEVWAVRLADLLDTAAPEIEILVDEAPSEPWLEAFAASRPTTADTDTVRALLAAQPPVAFAFAPGPLGLRPAAIARGQLAGAWLGVSAVWTDPGRRGEGLARSAVLTLASWAARRAGRYCYVQVAEGSTEARGLYARLGFELHHRYRYLSPPGEG